MADGPDQGTMMRGQNRRGAIPVAQNEVGKCDGPDPRRLLPRKDKLRAQAAPRYEYQARPISRGGMPVCSLSPILRSS